MKLDIIRIGNSRGVRLPKAVLEQCGEASQLELSVEGGNLILKPVRAPRAGWEEGFARMAAAGDDAPLLDEVASTVWDETEWTW